MKVWIVVDMYSLARDYETIRELYSTKKAAERWIRTQNYPEWYTIVEREVDEEAE